MPDCERCGSPVDRRFRFCPWCASPQRLKLVEFFRAHPKIAADRGRSLRVSRYLGPDEAERHVRFSVWCEEPTRARAQAAVSLDEREAERLAGFLLLGAPRRRLSILERLGLSRPLLSVSEARDD
jgi:hypothetical protein